MNLTAEKRTIILIERDKNGNEKRHIRTVKFAKGFGPYIHWQKRAIPVGAMDQTVYV